MSNGQIYTGFSSNLKSRISEHKNGGNITTRKNLPVRLIFYEAYINKEDAQRREKYFKTTKGKNSLRIMLAETLNTY